MNTKDMMNLEEVIGKAIKASGSPLSPSQIVEFIQTHGVSEDNEFPAVTGIQINLFVDRKDSGFQNVNGRIFPINEERWKALLSSLWYVQSVIRGSYNNEDINFIVPALYYFKRLWDCYIHKNKYYNEYVLSADNYIDLRSSELNYESFVNILPVLDKIIGTPVPIFTDVIKYINSNNYTSLRDVFKILQSLDTSLYSSNEYGAFFEYILDKIEIAGYGRYLTRTPYQVSELMARLLDAKGGKIYDPVCGSAGSLIEVAKSLVNANYSIKGSEISYRAAQLAFMNLFVHQIVPFELIQENVFNAVYNKELFDYIIADLPIDGSIGETELSFLSNKWNVLLPKNRKGFGAMLLLIASKLSTKGKAVVTVSDSFLSNSGYEERIREVLLKNDLIECVIGLPTGSLSPYTKGNVAVLIINNAKPSYLLGKVKFINVEAFSTDTEKIYFDPLVIAKIYNDEYSEDSNVQIVDNGYLIKDGSLAVRKYTGAFNEAVKLIKERRAIHLGDLVNIRSGVTIRRDNDFDDLKIPYVKIENLEKDILDMYLSPSKLNSYVDAHTISPKLILSDEALLIARIGDNMKPTLFKPSSRLTAIVVHSNVFVLQKKNEYALDLEYMYYQIYSPFVLGQVDDRRNRNVMSSLNRKELYQIIIPYMDLDAQESFVASQKANIIAAEKEKMNQRIQSIGYEEKGMQIESDIVQTLVHELRPKLVKIHAFAKKIGRIISAHNIDGLREYENLNASEFDEIFLPEENLTMREVNEIIIADSYNLSDILSSVKEIMTLKIDVDEFVKVDLYNFIEVFFEEKRREIGVRYALEVKGDHVFAFINKVYFKALLDQLISNAEKHGFDDINRKYKISVNIRFDEQKNLVQIKYSNNGSAFALRHKDYVSALTKSKKSDGSGIGGYYIYRIIKAHRGNMVVKENQNKGFAIDFELPINPNQHG
jgi:type I restriction-modification system DNA methylase subunit